MGQGKVTVFRYNPEVDEAPFYEDHPYPFVEGMSVMDVAQYINEEIDPTFSYSYCCLNSHCGLCGVNINGRPGLMCREKATREMFLEPLHNLPVIRDLIIDRKVGEERAKSLRLFLDRAESPDRPEKIKFRFFDKFKMAGRCVECYCCVSVCPVLRSSKHSFLGPSGLVQLSRYAFDERDELNRTVIANSSGVFNCTTCGRCEQVCPHKIVPAENIITMRRVAMEQGHVPEGAKKLAEMIESKKKALIMPGDSGSYLSSKVLKDRVEETSMNSIGLFVGCNIDYDARLKRIGDDAISFLEAQGVEVVLPREQVCCGVPLQEIGAHESEDLILQNVDLYMEASCRSVVTLCSGCALGMKTSWLQTLSRAGRLDGVDQTLPFAVYDFAEFIIHNPGWWESLDGKGLKITWHDPCSFKFGLDLAGAARKMLAGISNLHFVEMADADLCCGGGGGLRATNFKVATTMLKEKISTLRRQNIEEYDALVTTCPTCIRQIRMGLAQERVRGVEVWHLATLLQQCL